MKHFTLLGLCAMVAVLLGAHLSIAADQERPASQEPGVWAQVLEMYEKAKEAGEQVPQDVYQWAKQDISKLGDWEYLVADIPMADAKAVQARLNVLGAERWECIWIHPSACKTTFVFKRPTKSYLKHLPVSQLLKVLPRGESEGE